MRTIQDEFTNLPISRQRKWQLRKQRDRVCCICGAPAVASVRCLEHLVRAREHLRKARGAKRRYKHTLAYQLEQAAREAAQPVSSKPRRLRSKPQKQAAKDCTRKASKARKARAQKP